MDEVEALLDAARRRLGGVPREGLGELQADRRILGIPRAPRIVRVGEAWHLGALLLTDDAVCATGDILRARAEVRRGFAAEAQRRRAELAAAARRGGFAEGEVVHIGWTRIDRPWSDADAASGPLSVREGVPYVRWSTAGGRMPLAAYLDERIELLIHPPAGAN